MNLSKELWLGFGITVLFAVIVFFSLVAGDTPHNGSVASPIPARMTVPTTSMNATTATNSYSLSDVAKHNNPNDCWLVIANNVYNATNYLNIHPGGAEQIIPYCGTDATGAFQSIGKHQSGRAQNDLSGLLIGSIK